MITKREFDMLVLLTETKEVVSQKDMAERLKISAEAVNKTVKELTEKNYCENGRITQDGLDALEPYRVKRKVSDTYCSRLWKPDGADHFEYA